jgi:anaphase-promoting complex subunit 6
MDKYLRSWRQEALNKGQHDAAIYVGDKVLALTSMLRELPFLLRLTISRRRLGRFLACTGPFLQQQLHTSACSSG